MIDAPMANTQTPATFCIWLQGFLDGAGGSLDANQLATLKANLDTVFTHFDSDQDCAILTDGPEADTATETPFHLSDEFLKLLEKYKKLKPNKWVYDGPRVPQTWLSDKTLPYYPPSYYWPPQINC